VSPRVKLGDKRPGMTQGRYRVRNTSTGEWLCAIRPYVGNGATTYTFRFSSLKSDSLVYSRFGAAERFFMRICARWGPTFEIVKEPRVKP
jgi:hypothetical protein